MIRPRKTAARLVVCFSFLLMANALGLSQGCPIIEVETPAGPTVSGSTYTLNARVKGTAAVGNLGYVWTISGGMIEKGQNSETLYVITTRENAGQNITAKVTVSGLSSFCENTASGTIVIAPPFSCGLAVDTFGAEKANAVKARVDNIFIQLDNNPGTFALFEMEFDPNESTGERTLRITRILDAIKFRKYDLTKMMFLISQDETSIITRVRILPLSTNMTESGNQGKLIYGQDMKQKLSTLFQNN